MTLHIGEVYKTVPPDDNAIDNYAMKAHIG